MNLPRRTVALAALVFMASVAITSGIGYLFDAAADGQRAADRARDQAQAQASIVADQRKAQSRRIDLLTDQLHELEAKAREQAVTVGRQEQAIRDLAAQVQDSGGSPVVTSVSPRRTAERTPTPKPGTKPTTAPTTAPKAPTRATKAPTAPQPAPSTSSSPGLACSLLPLPILC